MFIFCSLTSQPIISGQAVKKPVVYEEWKYLSSIQRYVRGQFESNGIDGELKEENAGDLYQFISTSNENRVWQVWAFLFWQQ